MIDFNSFFILPIFYSPLAIIVSIFLGISIILSVYSIILFFYLKNKNYFYFFLYNLSIGCLNLSISGLFKSQINSYIYYVIFVVFFILFSINFLNIKKNQKIIHNILNIYLILTLIIMFLLFYNYGYSFIIFPLTFILFPLLLIIFSVIYVKNRYIIDKYYFYAIAIIIIASFLYFLQFSNFIIKNVFTIFCLQLLFVTNTIFLSFSLVKKLETEFIEKIVLKKSSILQELKIKDLLEETFDCFWETDKSGKFTFLSSNIYEKLGYEKQGIHFIKPDDFFADGAPNELKIQFRTIMSKHKSFKNLEIVSQANNGEFKWFKASAIVKYDEKKEFDGYVGALMDETHTRYKQYEEYVNVNTKSLARIAGAMAHEINNPLTYILLCIDSIINRKDSLEKKNHARILNNLSETKKKILKISKIVSKFQGISLYGSEINKVECKLSEIVDMAIKFCEYELKSLNVHYELEFNRDEKYIYVRKEEVSKALVNLIHNSIEATENVKHPWIRIALKNEGEDWIVLSIIDNGEGIPFDKRASVFEPFYTTKDFKKMGLGLTQSFQFVKKNGGELSLDPNANYTKFSMRFKSIKKENE